MDQNKSRKILFDLKICIIETENLRSSKRTITSEPFRIALSESSLTHLILHRIHNGVEPTRRRKKHNTNKHKPNRLVRLAPKRTRLDIRIAKSSHTRHTIYSKLYKYKMSLLNTFPLWCVCVCPKACHYYAKAADRVAFRRRNCARVLGT